MRAGIGPVGFEVLLDVLAEDGHFLHVADVKGAPGTDVALFHAEPVVGQGGGVGELEPAGVFHDGVDGVGAAAAIGKLGERAGRHHARGHAGAGKKMAGVEVIGEHAAVEPSAVFLEVDPVEVTEGVERVRARIS